MTVTETQAEDEMTARRFISIEDMILFHNPHLEYLTNLTLPVRPPTEEEAAIYAARRDDESWAEIYNPAEPRIVLPPHAPELTTLLSVVRDPEPEAIEGVALPDHPQLAEDQHKSLDALKRWAPNADTGSLSVVRDETEIHHDTQVLRVVPEDES
jgi:hypothetical protein